MGHSRTAPGPHCDVRVAATPSTSEAHRTPADRALAVDRTDARGTGYVPSQRLRGLWLPLCVHSDPGPRPLFLVYEPLTNNGGAGYHLQLSMHRAWGMGHGAWGMGHGAWGMGYGAWGMGHGAWGMGRGAWGMGHGAWGMGHGA